MSSQRVTAPFTRCCALTLPVAPAFSHSRPHKASVSPPIRRPQDPAPPACSCSQAPCVPQRSQGDLSSPRLTAPRDHAHIAAYPAGITGDPATPLLGTHPKAGSRDSSPYLHTKVHGSVCTTHVAVDEQKEKCGPHAMGVMPSHKQGSSDPLHGWTLRTPCSVKEAGAEGHVLCDSVPLWEVPRGRSLEQSGSQRQSSWWVPERGDRWCCTGQSQFGGMDGSGWTAV